MVRAWYMDDLQTSPQLEHHRDPLEFVSMDVLFETTGVEHFKLNIDTYETDGVLEKIKAAKGYTYEDKGTCSKHCEEHFKEYYDEHLHTGEEVRFIIEGCAYFDVRDKHENWIRVEATPGDMIIIPSGIYHRFSLDVNTYIKAMRFHVGEPEWFSYNRPAEDMPCRKSYIKKLSEGFVPEVV